MTRNRFIKLLMSRGCPRNAANTIADEASETSYISYYKRMLFSTSPFHPYVDYTIYSDGKVECIVGDYYDSIRDYITRSNQSC